MREAILSLLSGSGILFRITPLQRRLTEEDEGIEFISDRVSLSADRKSIMITAEIERSGFPKEILEAMDSPISLTLVDTYGLEKTLA